MQLEFVWVSQASLTHTNVAASKLIGHSFRTATGRERKVDGEGMLAFHVWKVRAQRR